jgi:hypothetical protein
LKALGFDGDLDAAKAALEEMRSTAFDGDKKQGQTADELKALSKGGVWPEMADHFAKVYGERVRWSEDGEKLEVLERMKGGEMVPGGASLDDLVAEIAKAEKAWFGATGKTGAGSKPLPVKVVEKRDPFAPQKFNLEERLQKLSNKPLR